MFESARLRLTAWYLVIIMFISVMFSIAIYNAASREVQRVIRIQELRTQHLDQNYPAPPEAFFRPRSLEDLQESRQRLAILLLIINGGIIIFAGGAAYFLAGITLKPIKKMVDEQNRFITDSSHELRTPLTSLRSEIEVALRNKSLSLVDAKRLLESNLEETISLQVLSDHLLELAQNGRGGGIDKHTNVSISQILNNAIRKIEPQAKRKMIIIQTNISDSIIKGVPDRLTEVFVILLDNAVKYSSKKSVVKISSQKQKNAVTVLVTDHGVGIEKEDLPYIWDRFFRGEKSRTKSETPGHGLGLSIAKKIIDSHNGRIRVESKPGKETTFSVILPS